MLWGMFLLEATSCVPDSSSSLSLAGTTVVMGSNVHWGRGPWGLALVYLVSRTLTHLPGREGSRAW